MKTRLNPRMKATEFSITLRSSCDSCDFNSSTPAPEMSDTYPGTSGNTHGERKETRPAKKAAMGSGNVDIGMYCTCSVRRMRANKCTREQTEVCQSRTTAFSAEAKSTGRRGELGGVPEEPSAAALPPQDTCRVIAGSWLPELLSLGRSVRERAEVSPGSRTRAATPQSPCAGSRRGSRRSAPRGRRAVRPSGCQKTALHPGRALDCPRKFPRHETG